MSNIRFLIIGAQKSGTTSLFEYLRCHPGIHMPPEKEIGFFHVARCYRRGWESYLAAVTHGAARDAVCGEASVGYMSGTPFGDIVENEHWSASVSLRCSGQLEEIVPRRIKKLLPEVRLICVLRDPVTRAYSHYRMEVLDKVESRSFEAAIDQALEPKAMAHARMAPTRRNSYVVNGEYGRILGGFLRVFPSEQLLVVTSDELSERPSETLAGVFEFIDVAGDFVPANLSTRYREAAVEQRITGLNLYDWQIKLARVPVARAIWRALPDSACRRVDRTYNAASYNIVMWNARRGVGSGDVPPLVRERLIAHFRPDSEALGDMLERDMPWLKTWDLNP